MMRSDHLNQHLEQHDKDNYKNEMFDYKNEMFAQQVLDQVKHIYKKNLRVNLVQCQLPNLLQLMWNL